MTGRWSGMRGGDESPDAPRPTPAPVPAGGLLGDLAARKGWLRRLQGARVHGKWREIAGDQLADHVEPVRLHGGVLVLRAESASWATQVRYLTGELQTRAESVLGPGQVTVVKVIVGRLEGTGDQPLEGGS